MADERPTTASPAASPAASPIAAQDQRFQTFFDGLFTDAAQVSRPTRAGGAADGFEVAAFAQAELLEVHFSDGSVFYTDPLDFAQRHAAGDATRSAAQGADRVRLPFTLNLGNAASLTRGGEAGAEVDHYHIARLTDPTPLDKLYDWGAKFADVLDRWFGGSSDPNLASQLLANHLCRAYEDAHLHPCIGTDDGVLLRWQGGGWRPAAELALPDDLSDVLVLLHGTASSTAGSFSGLWQSAAAGTVAPDWQALVDDPKRMVLALEHRSLTVSPLRNTLDLLRQLGALGLPPGLRMHWLSHSRGGMVGDLLALAMGAADEVNARAAVLRPVFEQAYPAKHPERALVAELFDLLQSRSWPPGWVAGTFVRVASPARGTLLADRRTDFFLSLLLRSVALAFGGNGNPWFERLQRLVRALVAARADAKSIPGLEAMIPGRPLSLALNTLPAEGWSLPGRLRVIAGDSQDLGLGGLLTMLGDVFYGLHDHDFVVHTHSMFGGFPRGDALSRRVADKSVTHFGYFKADSLTRSSVFVALRGDDSGFESMADDEARTRGLLQALVFEYSRWPQERWLQAIRAPGSGRKPIVVVLPGIMGSELAYVGQGADHPVWLGAASIFNGTLADLSLASARALQASGVMPMAYERVLAQARRQFHVVAMAYDWRLSVPDAAGRLIDLLKLLLPEAERMDVPVHLLAHSMGGLVSRLALWCDDFGLQDKRGDLTKKLEARGLRLLQCGTPNRGSYAPLQLLMQQHPLTRQIASAARGVTPADLARFGAGYPGLMAMLPDASDETFGDLFEPKNWEKIRQADPSVVAPKPALLRQASEVRTWLGASFDALCRNPQVFYVAGHDLTPLGLKLLGGSPAVPDRPGRPGRPALAPVLRLGVSMQGDGTVPWNSRLAAERTWYTDCTHGSLLDHTDAFDGYFELLQQGHTQKLSATEPVSRGAEALAKLSFELPAPPCLAADPIAYVLGLDSRAISRRPQEPIQLRVVHASLDYARHPLLVGHYLDGGLFGAIKRVDTKLLGQLKRALRFDLFSGAQGSSIYLRAAGPDGRRAPAYPGAIVLGLGQVGELSPAWLADTVTRGVLNFAFDHLYQDTWSRGEGPLELHLSAVLVGTNVRSITVRDSLVGLLQGVWRAAHMLADDTTLPRPVRIVEVELVELHESIALDAAYALEGLLERPDWRQRFAWPRAVLESREGGVRGYRRGQGDSQWQRLLVRCDALGALKFELIAERARVEATHNRADVFSLSDYVARACDTGAAGAASGGNDQAEFGRILYSLLLPQSLKGRLANFEPTVLLLDDRTAALPWELLTPPMSRSTGGQSAQPLAVQAGMVRQRRVTEFRDAAPLRRHLSGAQSGVLVVGAPDTAGWFDSGGQRLTPFATLPGAAEEARLVANMFSNDARRSWQVTRLLPVEEPGQGLRGARFDKVFTSVLSAQPWRVLHLAGHGIVDLWQRTVADDGIERQVRGTGMVLSDQQMLTAGLVEQMDPPPEFVFINCCYCGDTMVGLPALAANLALAFVKMGSRAVVAAGWQVNDADGKRFAETLYDQLLAGETFGSAVLAARQEAYKSGGARSNTWGAYQCYGDPAWSLSDADAAQASVDDGVGFRQHLLDAQHCKSAGELAERIAQMSAVAGNAGRDGQIMALDELVKALSTDPLRQQWLADSLVLSRLGEAWRELGERRKALDAFFGAASQTHSALTLSQADFAANLTSRLEPKDLDFDADATQASLAMLDRLDALEDALSWQALRVASANVPDASVAPRIRSGNKAERDCLRGSSLSRLATGTNPLAAPDRAKMLLEAASYYARAWQDHAALGSKVSEQTYALSNALVLAGMAVAYDSDWRPLVENGRWLRELLDAAADPAALAIGDPAAGLDPAFAAVDPLLRDLERDAAIDFWGYAGLIDLRLGRQLLLLAVDRSQTPDYVGDLPALADMLEVALARWPSPSQMDSLNKRPLQALAALQAQAAQSQSPAPALQTLITILQALLKRLEEGKKGQSGG